VPVLGQFVVVVVRVDPLGHQLAATQQHEQDRRHHQVDDQAGQEHGQLAGGQVVLLHHRVRDRAVDADRGEPAALRAVHDEHAHHQRVDLVLAGEAQRDRADDRAGGRTGGADRGQQRGDREHHPRDQRDPAADGPDRRSDDQVHGAVVLGDREQIGDTDQRQDQVAADAAEDLALAQVEGEHADQPRGDVRQRAHVDRQQRADHEQGDQRQDRYPLRSHRPASSVDEGEPTLAQWPSQ
jgi:hypothetical protein